METQHGGALFQMKIIARLVRITTEQK